VGHALARKCGRADHVVGVIEDWQDTCPGRGDAHVVRYSRQFNG
jgi:hypothetical protein